ncbi:sigma 54-interacting transcriptional regulator [Thalassotalea sp. Y01]|uniref:sigma 54-interacting transcriptional regulator n=1 Tax=Thalassotalea sp. Y01 TaxID=2729613 RepID=UPI00145ECB37|nr:sigma 54-interacting transcriptional regulator [Thalassotalea sp. Y01]NMP17285.1 sigma 54-interacting transcriptional regulator [Thalassotalea sp. Y01]
MRLNVISTNRLGITQQILTVIAEAKCDIIAMEVAHNHTYVHIKDNGVAYTQLSKQILTIEGVHKIDPVTLLPGEKTAQQLQALFANIPEPIIDIDNKGFIINANRAALIQVALPIEQFVGQPLQSFIQQKLRIYLSGQSTTQEINFAGNPYYADITPVRSEQEVSGAVIVLRSLLNVGRHLSQYQQGVYSGFDSIIGQSQVMLEIKELTRKYASNDLPVLISGETGTGKELLAKALHDNGQRASKPMLAINCAAMPEHMLEAELFGYAAGAFTGAKSGGKPGLLELADGGTVFLDEIGEMDTALQAKLLRFLQDLKIRRLGGVKDRQVDVRIVSASHRNLDEMVEQKTFREDLYYRLNVLQIDLPPIRDRHGDIELLVEHFLKNAAMQVNQPELAMSQQTKAQLVAYHWPGNVRQLQNTIFRLAAQTDSDIIDAPAHFLQDKKSSQNKSQANDALFSNIEQQESWLCAQQDFERQLLSRLYPLYPSTRKLAERLQVSHNKIAMKLRAYGIKTSE